MKKIKSIKTQSDFDRQMSSLSDELRNIITPLLQEEDRIKITISEHYFRKSEILVALEQNRTLWAEIQDKKNIREEKLACLAEGRRLKLELAKIGGGISLAKMQLRRVQQERRLAAQPYHDKMHELVMKYPKGSLPIIA